MDTGRPGPPDPGGQAYQQLGECSSPNGTFVKGVTQRQNKPGPAAGGSSGSPRQPQIGKHKASSAARSQQPESASACEAQSLDAILGSAPPGTAKETRPQLRQGKREKIAAASATSTGDTLDENIRTGSESKRENEHEGRISEPPQAIFHSPSSPPEAWYGLIPVSPGKPSLARLSEFLVSQSWSPCFLREWEIP